VSTTREPRTRNGERLLSVAGLTTVFETAKGPVAAVDEVGFEIYPGETLGLVGESGSGKSVTALSIMRLVQPPGRIASGRILFRGADLLTLDDRAMQRVRGAQIALIFQEPMTALNPVFRVGDQIAETLLVTAGPPGGRRRARRSSCCEPCASRTRSLVWTTTRTNYRAACDSAS
jgi:ABC-type dipeptide/oligopeptide/nickel transport system, ATPase component